MTLHTFYFMWYVFDEHRNIADKDNLPNKSTYTAGKTYTFDNVEVYCLLGTADTDHPLFVDKKHDLSYYVNGSDWVNSEDYTTSPGKYGYEWGGYNTKTGVTATAVGSGLSNTNSLIAKNLQPRTSGWYVVWDKIKEFRQSHSDKWFLPSKDELNLIYKARNNLSNLSTSSTEPMYWASSEYSGQYVCYQTFYNGGQNYTTKNDHHVRSRLCYTI